MIIIPFRPTPLRGLLNKESVELLVYRTGGSGKPLDK